MIWQAIILGVVQGLTEFIPISSSAHLVAIPKLFRWHDMGLAFDVALHYGTLVAVVVYFRHDWKAILWSFFGKKGGESSRVSGKMVAPLLVACVPAALTGLFLNDRIEALRDWPKLLPAIALVLIGVGMVMLLAERVGKKRRGIGQMNWTDYMTIGIAQALALFPGVSRSGITISAGLFRNLDRAGAARFSFLLSTPVIFGAGLLELADLVRSGFPAGQAGAFAIGFLTSALSGYLAIAFLMNYLGKRPLNAFVTYRVCFAIFLLLASQ